MMNTIFALSMVAGVGLTTGTPVIGARKISPLYTLFQYYDIFGPTLPP